MPRRSWRNLLSRTAPLMFAGLAVGQAYPAFAQESATPSPAIQVTINGQNIPFPGQGPLQTGGSILVPLRGVFEKLGANVEFNPATRMITASRGETTILLVLGETRASINGREQTLTAPAVSLGGTTLVPLRFVSEALGAQVKWNPTASRVEITTDAVIAEKQPTLPTSIKRIVGTVSGVYPEADAISLRVRDGENRRLSLAPGAFVQVRQAGAERSASINTLRVGDQVTAIRDDAGYVKTIVLVTDERRGTVKSVENLGNGNVLVRLTNGTAVEVLGNVPVTMSGRRISLKEIKDGERIVIRVQPETLIGISVALATGDDPDPTPVTPTPVVETARQSAVPRSNPATVPNATPAPEPPATVPASEVQIKEVAHDAGSKILKGGETVTVTVTGTPGGEVFLSIPRFFEQTRIPLPEKPDEPGTYAGSFTVPFNVTAKEIVVSATLTKGETATEAVSAKQPLRSDATAPIISTLEPAENATLPERRPKIGARFADADAGVSQKQVRIYVNDTEVTGKTLVSDNGFAYSPSEDLPPGPVTVRLVVPDEVGNEASRTWKFTVKPKVQPIRTITVGPTNVPLRARDVVNVRLVGAAGGEASFRLETKDDVAMKEIEPGVYQGAYIVQKGDNIPRARIYLTFVHPEVPEKILREAPETVNLMAIPPVAPVIESPKEGETVGKQLVLSGKADPNGTVKINIQFEGKRFLARARGTLDPVEVKVNSDGTWQSAPISLELRNISISSITVEATVTSISGDTSTVTSIKYRRK